MKNLMQIIGISLGIMFLAMATRDYEFFIRLPMNILGLFLLMLSLDSRYRKR